MVNKTKKALLVYPEVPKNTYWSFNHALKFVGKKSNMPPLGLITLAALFPEHWELRLVDMNVSRLRDKDILWADAVFVSAMIVQKDSFARVVKRCNLLAKPVVAGGPYPGSSHHEIQGVSHFVLGEVEDTFAAFVDDLEAGRAAELYPAPPRPGMSRRVIPRYDLLKWKSYASMAVQYSRGCPFKCEFCDIWKAFGNKPRLKAPANVLAELDALYELGWRGAVFVVDDNFIGNKSRAKKELLPAFIEWQKAHGFPYRFYTEASINMAQDTELLTSMSSAGFNEVFIGIETPSAESLKETGKVQNLQVNMRQAIRTIQEHGIEVMAGFILGFDSDTDDIADRQIQFIQQSCIPQAMVGLLIALPGTDLYHRLEREGRIIRASDGNNTDCAAVNFQTRMDGEHLKAGYRKVMATIYDKNLKNYFDRCSRLLDTLGKPRLSPRDIRMEELWIAAKSIIRQPFTPYGVEYVKFLARNFVKNNSTFSEAIKYGIVGHHFHAITQQILATEPAFA